MNAPAQAIALNTVEDVTDAFDSWALPNQSLEMKVRVTALGTHVMLFEAGRQVAVGRGRGLANALANALEALEDQVDPDEAEDRWNANHSTVEP